MSQEKVNAYRDAKANRKEKYASEQKKQKRNKFIAKLITGIVVVGLAAALVVTGINIVRNYIDGRPTYDAEEFVLDDYMKVGSSNQISAEDLVSGGNVTIGENGETIISGGDDTASEEAPLEAEENVEENK